MLGSDVDVIVFVLGVVVHSSQSKSHFTPEAAQERVIRHNISLFHRYLITNCAWATKQVICDDTVQICVKSNRYDWYDGHRDERIEVVAFTAWYGHNV